MHAADEMIAAEGKKSDKWTLSPEVKKEFREIWLLSLPVIATNALLMLLQIEDQIVLGHLGDDEVSKKWDDDGDILA